MLGLHVSVVVRITLFISKWDPWPPISLLIVVIPCSLYSAHVKLGPCHWPSKGDWLLERRVLFAISFSVCFLVANPPSISVTVSQLASSCWFLSDFFLSSICFYYSLFPLIQVYATSCYSFYTYIYQASPFGFDIECMKHILSLTIDPIE